MFLTKIKKYKNFFKILKKPAFTLIEVLVFLFIFTVITGTFYSVFSVNSRYSIDAKDRQSSVAIANEKMETIRNLKYSDIGTVAGIPSGNIQANENVTVDGKIYAIRTFIKYQDDSFDGVYPADTIPNDYKIVKITVSWAGVGGSASDVELISRFVPPGLELVSGNGVLAINVINNEGIGISQAKVHIENNEVSPTVDLTTETDDSGNLIFSGAEESMQKYKLTVSKDGYETVETVDPDEVFYVPVDTNASVIQGLLNTKSIIINPLSNIKIKSVDYLGAPLSSVAFKLEGGRVLGTDTLNIPAVTIYNTNIEDSTGAEGEKDLEDKNPGQYTLFDVGTVSGYTLISVEPVSPVTVLPDENKEIEIKFAKNDEDSLAVYVLRESDDAPIKNAKVHLTNESGYGATVETESDGVAVFPLADGSVFAPGDYNIEITAEGFQDNNSTATVNDFTVKTVKLTEA